MRRADRLFQIVQFLRGGRLRTAQQIAEHLEVSVRTIYRDIQSLIATGVPIEGEAGIGYVIRSSLHLPPLTFTETELQALVLGARFVKAWGDSELVRAAEEALVKIDAVLPSGSKGYVKRQNINVYVDKLSPQDRLHLKFLRRALRDRQKISFQYLSLQDEKSERTVRPLGLEAWGHAWTLTGWCESRQDFRVFRLDRISDVIVLDEFFTEEHGKTLRDYIKGLRTQGLDIPDRDWL